MQQMTARAMLLVHLSAASTLAMALASCHGQEEASVRAGVIVVAQAEDLRTSDMLGGRVAYIVREPYPGQQSIDEVRSRLTAQGWHRRERSILDPASTFEITARWRPLSTDKGDVFGWSEQWENPSGDVVVYSFEYAAAAGDEPSADSPMRVFIAYFKASEVRALQSNQKVPQ